MFALKLIMKSIESCIVERNGTERPNSCVCIDSNAEIFSLYTRAHVVVDVALVRCISNSERILCANYERERVSVWFWRAYTATSIWIVVKSFICANKPNAKWFINDVSISGYRKHHALAQNFHKWIFWFIEQTRIRIASIWNARKLIKYNTFQTVFRKCFSAFWNQNHLSAITSGNLWHAVQLRWMAVHKGSMLKRIYWGETKNKIKQQLQQKQHFEIYCLFSGWIDCHKRWTTQN